MNRASAVLDPECPQCRTVMAWQRVRLIDAIPSNVFKCDGCEQVATVPARATAMTEAVD